MLERTSGSKVRVGRRRVLIWLGIGLAASAPLAAPACARGGHDTSRAAVVAAPHADASAGSDAAVSDRVRPRAPDVRYEPSAPEIVDEMLRMAGVNAHDVVYDLGCGDGRIVIAAVERFGARGVCVDIDPERIRESRRNAVRAGVADRIRFLNQDLLETDLSDASVVMLFLSQELNLRLRPKLLRELNAGARVVSHWHDMGDWSPDQTSTLSPGGRSRNVYLWSIGGAGTQRPM